MARNAVAALGVAIALWSYPRSLSATPGECAYIASYGALHIVDTLTNKITASVSNGSCGESVVTVSPDGERAYVGHFGGISVVDTATNRVVDTLSDIPGFQRNVTHIAFTPDGTRAYVTTDPLLSSLADYRNIQVIDTATRTFVATIEGATNTVISRDGRWAYALSDQLGDRFHGIKLIEVATNAVVATIPEVRGRDLLLSADDQSLYVVSPSNPITVVDTQTLTIRGTIQAEGFDFALGPDGNTVYTADNTSDNTVTARSLLDGTVVTRIQLPAYATSVAISPDGASAYAAMGEQAQVVAIDVATSTITKTYPVLGTDIAVAAVPNGCAATACEGDCNGDGNVTIDELTTAVDISLSNNGSRCGCEAFAAAGNVRIPVDALIRAVNLALDGCP